MNLDYPELDDFLRRALDEDISTGDVTTDCCVEETAISKGSFYMKEPGVICGLGVAARVFGLLDDTVCVTAFVSDGDTVSAGAVVAEISGPSRAILTGERLALNLLQHMSGVATRTAEAVREVSGTKTLIKDTRKTTPGMRALEKYAVKCGGGSNHRFNLADGALIKDNHIRAAGGIESAVRRMRSAARYTARENPVPMLIEVETESLGQVSQALTAGADIIMLDNMPSEMMAEAVKIINGRALTEASGNMDKRDLRAIAETGVDFISIGALTHSVKALDISLRFD